ncbi:putative integral membrane sensor signal transduction histidine kinase [Streptomyces sp. Tu6071]|uniref:histidine kinase dimerization/phosphoacceptor domain-containing protein n=1 Tax=Streptomyces sp. Tu6071 TaxID=355249 RepID=UPI00020E52A2|nr:histidine kinase dimerization/phosphoacceptor domain-containing protein [Streptomyces sp. Tu6071]EGJ73777.1 putative integral membrane sensor signal transduction histidine kinase [Streptomyces sp. Tu6071]
MDWRIPFAPLVRRLLSTAALATLLLVWLADVGLLRAGAERGGGVPLTAWLSVLLTGPLAACALPDHPRLPALTLRVRALGIAALSLAVTLAAPWQGSAPANWGVLESLALLVLLVRVFAEVRAPGLLAAVLTVALLLQPLRLRDTGAFFGGLYVLAAALAGALVLGASVRSSARRSREALSEERRALARDVHDLLGHHVTGIIVQAHAALRIGERRRIEETLESIARGGTESLDAMRALVRVLREETPREATDPLTEIQALLARHDPVPHFEANLAARSGPLPPVLSVPWCGSR